MKQENEKDKKYYWLRLKKDFFKRHDIQIIENMPNGKDYVLFYLKLLVESVDHIGELRFSDTIPYNEQMLSTITNTNIDIVRSAMKVFMELKMIEILSDQTIFMAEIEKLIGSETYWAEQKRKSRANIGQCPTNVLEMSEESPTCPSKSIEIEIDKEKDIDKDIKKEKKNKEEVTYVPDELLNQTLIKFIEMRKKIKAPMTEYAIGLLIKKLDKLAEDNDTKIEILNQSIESSWKGIFPLKNDYKPKSKAQQAQDDFVNNAKEWLNEQ